MPTYSFKHPDTGATIKITGDTPPDEATLDQIFAEAGGNSKSYGQWDATQQETKSMREKFLADEGTLATRVRNTSAGDMAYNTAMEAPRIGQEIFTVPLSSAKKGIYGIGALARTGGDLIRGKSLDEALQSGTDVMAGYSPLRGPMDPSMLGTGIGYAADKGIRAAENATGNTGWAEAGITAGMDIAGLIGGGKVLGKTGRTLGDLGKQGFVKNVPETFEMSMYKRGLKGQGPFNGLKLDEYNRRLNTALDEGIPLTEGGVSKLKTTVAELNKEVMQRINDFARDNVDIDMNAVLSPVERIKASANSKAFPEKARAQIAATVAEFKRNLGPSRTSAVSSVEDVRIPIDKAQVKKQSINTDLNEFYDAMQKSPDKAGYLARQWVQKTKAAIADGLREQISEVFPEVKALNAREGALIQLNKSLERAVNRIGQRDIISLKFLTALAKHPVVALGEYVLNNPKMQSHLAIAIRKARNKVNGKAAPVSSAGEYIPQPAAPQPAYPGAGKINANRPDAALATYFDPTIGASTLTRQGAPRTPNHLPSGPEMYFDPTVGAKTLRRPRGNE